MLGEGNEAFVEILTQVGLQLGLNVVEGTQAIRNFGFPGFLIAGQLQQQAIDAAFEGLAHQLGVGLGVIVGCGVGADVGQFFGPLQFG